MTRFSRSDGQVTVLTAVFLVALVGMVGFVLDVGSWFREQRVAQATVDAAALAGAQALPSDPTSASSLATSFAAKNGGVAGATFTVSSTYTPNDTIKVSQAKPTDGLFSKLFGISTVTVHAHAAAVSGIPTSAQYVAPIVVNISNPNLSGPGCPCFGTPASLPLGKTGAPGSFTMLDLLLNDPNGTVGAKTLADWIVNGFNNYLPLGQYFSDPGAKFNDNTIQAALQSRYGTDLLFPVYDTLIKEGSNAEYHIIGWAGFHLTLAAATGTGGTLSGYFTRVIWKGLLPVPGQPGPNIPDLGVRSVALID